MEFSDAVLQTMVDVARVRKVYKLNNSGGGRGIEAAVKESNKLKEERELEVLVLGSMALRGSTN